MQAKGDYYVCSRELPDIGKLEALERECGDYIEVANLKGVVFNIPGYVAAFGGIPDELKIDGGISFLIPWPTFKYPKHLSEDPLEAYNVQVLNIQLVLSYREAIESSCLIWKKEWDYGNDIHQRPTILRVEVNMTPTLGIWKGLGSWHPLRSIQYIEGHYMRSKHDNDIENYMSFKSPTTGHTLVAYYSGDDLLVIPYMGLIINQPQIVAAVGSIPDEHKIIGGISFSIPNLFFKFPTKLIEDPIERHKVDFWNDNTKQLLSTLFMQAYKTAVGVRVDSSVASNFDHVPAPHNIEVNIPKGQVSGEKGMSEAGIEKLFNSIWSIFSHSILQPMEEKTARVVKSGCKEDSTEEDYSSAQPQPQPHKIIGVIPGPTKEAKEYMEFYAYRHLVVRAVHKEPLIRLEQMST